MFATQVSAWLQRRGIHYGWIVAAITFLTMLTMSAALGLPGAMLQPLGKEFGWSTEQISSSLALRFALFGLMGPFAAVLMERWGLRAVICTGLALVGLGMALVTMASQLWQLFVLWSLMLGLGTGMTALVLGAVVANRWFVARRGLVVGMLTASSATGQLAFLPVAAWMIEHWGWRSAIVPIVIGSLLIGVLALCLMRNRPSDLGLRPFGEAPDAPQAPAAPAAAINFATPFRVLKEVATNRTGPLRQPQAALLVLRPARALAVLAAAFGIHHLRPRPVRDVLRPRLDRDRAAHGQARGRRLRTGQGRHGVRLGVRRPPARRRHRGLWRGLRAHAAADLHARALRGRRRLPAGGRDRDGDPPPHRAQGPCRARHGRRRRGPRLIAPRHGVRRP
jgi:hypothetical protein